MIRTYRLLTAIVAIIGVVAFVAPGPVLAKAHHHHSGQQMLGDKIKTNGQHEIDKVGEHRVSVNVTNGKHRGEPQSHEREDGRLRYCLQGRQRGGQLGAGVDQTSPRSLQAE